ncbi:MAG TPA: hypothetical protein VKY92_08675 [Verrucomicrobiae bacterium]|nr:hypothetical protein [Verrucomicrobiae bacterium]
MKPTKVTIPEELKADLPQSRFGKILGATPVVMAVVATMLAGLASSEMTRAQYDRSLGAQQQSKAGDQWSFFQAKRLRGAIQRNSADLLQTIVEPRAFEPAALNQYAEQSSPGDAAQDGLRKELSTLIQSPAGQQALKVLQAGEPPKPSSAAAPVDPKIKAAKDGVETSTPDAELAVIINQVDNKSIDAALNAAREQAQDFDTATKPTNQAIDQLDSLLGRISALRQKAAPGDSGGAKTADPLASLVRDFTSARLRYASARYEVEARLNQTIANLFEVQVRKSNISAEHHHRRSQRFFFGMLAAQTGVIISTLAMAAKNRNLLWSIAAAAGLLAVAFAIYVFLYV